MEIQAGVVALKFSCRRYYRVTDEFPVCDTTLLVPINT
jgi:hypothetical protein